MFDIEYDKDLDTVNIEVFERTGFDNSTERRFRCVCCKKTDMHFRKFLKPRPPHDPLVMLLEILQ